MNKKLLALAVAAALAPAAAMADSGNVTISGKIAGDVTFVNGTGMTNTAGSAASGCTLTTAGAVSCTTPAVAATSDNNTHQVNNNNSNMTFAGNEDLGNGNKAFFSLTYGLPLTNGGTVSGQNQIVGLEGKAWGKVFVGAHDNPLKVMGRGIDFFGDQSTGDARTLTNVGAVEARANDVVAYVSPSFGGAQVVLAHSNNPLGTVATDAAGSTDMNIIKLAYANGPFSAAIGYHRVDSDADSTPGDEKATRVTAAYAADAFKVAGSWQKVDNAYANGSDYKVGGLGASYKTGATTLKAQYYRLTNDTTSDADANMWALGADYSLSKRTTLQLAYSKVNNDTNANYGGASGVAGADSLSVVAGKDPSRLSLGIKHTF